MIQNNHDIHMLLCEIGIQTEVRLGDKLGQKLHQDSVPVVPFHLKMEEMVAQYLLDKCNKNGKILFIQIHMHVHTYVCTRTCTQHTQLPVSSITIMMALFGTSMPTSAGNNSGKIMNSRISSISIKSSSIIWTANEVVVSPGENVTVYILVSSVK